MDHLIAGEREPRVPARLARTRAKAKIPRPEQALDGTEFFTQHHARLLKAMLRRIDALDADITQVSCVIEELLAPGKGNFSRLSRCPAGSAPPPNGGYRVSRRADSVLVATSG